MTFHVKHIVPIVLMPVLMVCFDSASISNAPGMGIDSLLYKHGLTQFKRNCAICHADTRKVKLVAEPLPEIMVSHKSQWIIDYTLNEKDFMYKKRGPYYIGKDGEVNFEHQFAATLQPKDIADILYYIKKK